LRKAIITGGKRLEGTVRVSGSKNAALPILAATVLLRGDSVIGNIPYLNDVITMLRVLRALGLRAEYHEPNTVKLWTDNTIKHVAPYELVTKMRASFFIIGPILARMGLAKVPLPGGCAIGSRPVDLHLKGLKALGAKVEMEHGFVIVKANKLKGDKVYLDFPSVGATESIMMAATLAEGDTIIENAAQEPEIVDLANFLNRAGARISGAGSEKIFISGVSRLKGVEYNIIPDRIEAGTFMVASAITRGDLRIRGVVPEHIEAVTTKLQEGGVDVQVFSDEVKVKADKRFKAVDVKTSPYPGFPTDMQPQLAALLAVSEGTSVVTEAIFENRFMHVHELRRMGANIKLEDKSAIITGIPKLSGAPVRATDLRAGAALILAGLVADGNTIVDDIERFIDRGYEKFVEKLSSVGARIKEVGFNGEEGSHESNGQ
jgi:UDP-N-acetylglucosamine 1-carboxyvinyltransferase